MRKCAVLGCRSNYTKPYVSVFQFPKNHGFRTLWLKKIGRPFLNITDSVGVCIKHFEKRFLLHNKESCKDGGRKRLTLPSSAVPTIFDQDDLSSSGLKRVSKEDSEGLDAHGCMQDTESKSEQIIAEKSDSKSSNSKDKRKSAVKKASSPTTDRPFISILKSETQPVLKNAMSDDDEVIVDSDNSMDENIANILESPFKSLTPLAIGTKNEEKAPVSRELGKGVKRTQSVGSTSSTGSLDVNKPSPQLKKRKADKPAPTVLGKSNDCYCWVCHREYVALSCIACPRAYHHKCAGEYEKSDDWVCAECSKVLKAENVDTRSSVLSEISLDKLCTLLRFSLTKMKQRGGIAFHQPVSLKEYPMYHHYVIHPMDFSLLEKNIKQKLYGCTEAFLSDVKWILHNSCVFNGNQHPLSTNAKSLIKTCENDMQEIEVCPDCFMHSIVRNKYWFSEVCHKPHPLVWAKLKGFPYWPAKVARIADGNIDARFFGAHDRAWVPINQCYHLSKEVPTTNKPKKKGNYETALDELNVHVQLFRQKFGVFTYAGHRTLFDSDNNKLMYHGVDIDKVLEIALESPSPQIGVSESPSKGNDFNLQIEESILRTTNRVSDLDTTLAKESGEADNSKTLHEVNKGDAFSDSQTNLLQDKDKPQETASDTPVLSSSNSCHRNKLEMVLEKIKGLVSIPDDEEEHAEKTDEESCAQETEDAKIVTSPNKNNPKGIAPGFIRNLLKSKPLPDIDLTNVEESSEKEPLPVLDTSKRNDSFSLKLNETIEFCKARLGVSGDSSLLEKEDSQESEESDRSDDDDEEEDDDEEDDDDDDENMEEDDDEEDEEEDEDDEEEEKEQKAIDKETKLDKIDNKKDEAADIRTDLKSAVSSTNQLVEVVRKNISENSNLSLAESEDNEVIDMSSDTDIDESLKDKDQISSQFDKRDKETPNGTQIEPQEVSHEDKLTDISPEKNTTQNDAKENLLSSVKSSVDSLSSECNISSINHISSHSEKSGISPSDNTKLIHSESILDADMQSSNDESPLPRNKEDIMGSDDDDIIVCPPVKPPTPPLICLDDGTETDHEDEKSESSPQKPMSNLTSAESSPLDIKRFLPGIKFPTNARKSFKRQLQPENSSDEDDSIRIHNPRFRLLFSGAKRTFKHPNLASTPALKTPEKLCESEVPSENTSPVSRINEMLSDAKEVPGTDGKEKDVEKNGIEDSSSTNSLPQSPENLNSKEAEISILKKKLSSLFTAFHLQHWKHAQEKSELKHNMNLILMEMRASLEADKKQSVDSLIRKLEIEKIKALEETKKKQWCASCLKESRYACCWNTSYCSVPCQKRHFLVHRHACKQLAKNGDVPAEGIAKEKKVGMVWSYKVSPKTDSASDAPTSSVTKTIVSTKSPIQSISTSISNSPLRLMLSPFQAKKLDASSQQSIPTEGSEKSESEDSSKVEPPHPEDSKLKWTQDPLEERYFPSPPSISFEGLDTAIPDDTVRFEELQDAIEKAFAGEAGKEQVEEEKEEEEEMFLSDEENTNNELVSIGHDVKIKAKFLNKCLIYGQTAKKLARCLVDVIFTDINMLASCCALGNKSNITKSTRNALPPDKVMAIVDYVQSRFPSATRSEIILAMNMKCKEARALAERNDSESLVRRSIMRRSLARDQDSERSSTNASTSLVEKVTPQRKLVKFKKLIPKSLAAVSKNAKTKLSTLKGSPKIVCLSTSKASTTITTSTSIASSNPSVKATTITTQTPCSKIATITTITPTLLSNSSSKAATITKVFPTLLSSSKAANFATLGTNVVSKSSQIILKQKPGTPTTRLLLPTSTNSLISGKPVQTILKRPPNMVSVAKGKSKILMPPMIGMAPRVIMATSTASTGNESSTENPSPRSCVFVKTLPNAKGVTPAIVRPQKVLLKKS